MVDSKCRVPGATLERRSIGTKNIIARPACPRVSGLLLRKNIRGTNLAGVIRPKLGDHSLAVSCTALHVLRHDKPAISTMPSRLWMFHAGRASERPGLRDLWPTRLLANFWQNGFLMTSPLDGESENRRVYIGDLNGGPGWT